jgi:hypothetical protein
MPRPRVLGLVIAATGIGFSLLTSTTAWLRLGQPWFSRHPATATTVADLLPRLSETGLLVFAGTALIVLLFSKTVPRWWSLAYALFALLLLAVIIWREGNAAAEFFARYRRDPDVLFTGWEPPLADYVVIGLRLILGVVASLAIAAPLILPPRFWRRPPDVPALPLGL